MRIDEARTLGRQVSALVQDGHPQKAYARLAPTLAARTKFPMLERIGEPIGAGSVELVNPFLDEVAAGHTEGGWVVIGAALREQLDLDLPGAIRRAREYIVAADVWYATDIIGERVPGQALVDRFDQALEQLEPWRWESNKWVRRSVGVAVHLWAKRSHGVPELEAHAEDLMNFLEPLISDWDLDAIKGTTWGLKTLGRYYPDSLTDWLVENLPQQTRTRIMVRRKPLIFLSEEQKAKVMAVISDQ